MILTVLELYDLRTPEGEAVRSKKQGVYREVA